MQNAVEVVQEIRRIMRFKQILKHIHFDTEIFLDLDNTILETTHELGSDEWFSHLHEHCQALYQNKNVATNVCLDLYNAVQAHVEVNPVEIQIIFLLKALHSIGIPLHIITARGFVLEQDTQRQLRSCDLDFLADKVIYCNGANKGDMMHHFFQSVSGRMPSHVLMVDDKFSNVERVFTKMQVLGIAFNGFEYRFLHDRLKYFNMHNANFQLKTIMHVLSLDIQDLVQELDFSTQHKTCQRQDLSFHNVDLEESKYSASI